MSPAKLIKLSKSCIGEAEKNAVIGVLDREYLGMGAEVQQFEQALTEFFGRPTVCVSNGTAALQLALQACGIGKGDEVLVQSLTYVASFQAISATGAMPVACDIDKNTFSIDLVDSERKLTRKTKAIMPVHYGSSVGDLDRIYEFARKKDLRIIEDAAHAFGTVYKNNRVGSFGDIACFSFDGIKNITSGEGGCIVTYDSNVIEKVKDYRLLSVERDTESRFSGRRTWEFNVKSQGWRYHMSNIMAAIGMEQLKKFPKLALQRQKLAKKYDEIFFNNNSIITRSLDYDKIVPHIYTVQIPNLSDRTSLQKQLLEFGIQTGFHYQPNHNHDFYAKDNLASFPVTDILSRELLSLPLHPDLTERDIGYVGEVLMKLVYE